MGFRQKSRKLRWGPLEYVALVLVGLTMVTGTIWWQAAPRAQWLSAPARVTAVSLVENTHAIEASRPSMQVHFNYTVDGRTYQGQARFDRVTRLVYGKLPKEIQDLLHSKGYLSFKDLPPNVQRILRQKGVRNFSEVPAPILQALRAQGYNSVQDFPEDVERLLREGRYDQAAELAGFSDATLRALNVASQNRGNAGRPSSRGAQGGSPAAQTASILPASRPAVVPPGTMVQVRFDPLNPTRHEVVRVPFVGTFANIALFLGVALLTLAYGGVIYPRLKQR